MAFLIATNETAEFHPSYVRALWNQMWVDMWIIYVSKNKGSCDFCFALKYSPMHSLRQEWWCRVYSMRKHRSRRTCIQYCTNSAQLDVCFKNVHFNFDLFVELKKTSANIRLWKYDLWYCLIKSVHPLILPLSFSFSCVGVYNGHWQVL